ncbi:IS66 family transposase [bacterium]|nr:IS66 family transposase [bacterium]
MSQDELEQLSKQEIIELILRQHQQIEELMEAYKKLKADHEALVMKFEHNQKPPTNSGNSSQPPSKDQKKNKPKDKRKRHHGPPKGHEKHEREQVANPDKIIELHVENCKNCQSELDHKAEKLVRVNQISELPEIRPQVIEVRQYEEVCPHCGVKQRTQAPDGLEVGRSFGARLESTVVYYRQEQHMSYQRTQQALWNLYGLKISQGGIDGIMQKAGEKAAKAVKEIEAQIRQSTVIHCDETSSRVGGNNWWEWVFCSTQAVLHVIRFNRSKDVIDEVMGNHQAEVWVSDCYSAQMNAPAYQRQLCLAHQLRNLQAAVEIEPSITWAKAMQILFRYAIHLQKQRGTISPEEYNQQVARIERHCDRLLARKLAQPQAKRLQKRYLKYRQCLFVFLDRDDVHPTNNVAERALRPSVVHRKVIGCFRSDWGVKAFADLASLIDTAELAGKHAFQAILTLMATPTYSFLPIS